MRKLIFAFLLFVVLQTRADTFTDWLIFVHQFEISTLKCTAISGHESESKEWNSPVYVSISETSEFPNYEYRNVDLGNGMFRLLIKESHFDYSGYPVLVYDDRTGLISMMLEDIRSRNPLSEETLRLEVEKLTRKYLATSNKSVEDNAGQPPL